MGRGLRRIRLLLRKGQVEESMDREMDFHLEMEVEANLKKGMTPDQARREALRAFGGVERFKERARDERGGRLLDDLGQDLRFTTRKLRRSPGFTLAVLLTLALGIGANTAIFTLVDGILLQPLPFPEPDRLARVFRTAPERGADRGSHSLPDGRDWGEGAGSVQHLGLYTTLPSGLIHTGGNQARELSTAYVSADFFPALATPALHGRTLPPEAARGDNRVLVLSHGFWLREFGRDPGVVGQSMDMEGIPFRIAGVMPPAFAFPNPEVEVWTFLTVIPPEAVPFQLRDVRILNAVARLVPGVGLEEAEAELTAVAQGVEEETAEGTPEVVGARLVSLRDAVVGDARLALLALLGAVGLILVLACANVANLLLARGIGRGQEMALRSALGAGRHRLIQQLLTESVLLGLLGGALGVLLAVAGVEGFVERSAGLLPRSWEVGMGWDVLLFTLVISLLTGLIFGLLPALTASSGEPALGLREGSHRGSTARGHGRLRHTLVVAQVTVAVVLLVGAGLMARSFARLQSVDPGFRAQGLLAVTVSLSDVLFEEREAYMGAFHELLEGFRALPGVEGAGAMRFLPMQGSGEQHRYEVGGRAPPPEGQEPQAWVLHVSTDLFRVMGIPLLAGRTFTPEDRPESPFVVVINETLSREAFGGEDPVGRTVAFGGAEIRIIGVVGDVHQESLREPPQPTIYIHHEQNPRTAMTFVLRTAGAPLTLAGGVRRVVSELNPGQPISEITDVREVVGGSTARARFLTLLLASFALLAFTLAGIGIYGLVAYMVARQLPEIGIRLALGAEPMEAVRLVLRRGMMPVILGLGLGLLLALPLNHLIRGLLFQVEPTDPLAYLLGGFLLLSVALVATLMPARRIVEWNPRILLRKE